MRKTFKIYHCKNHPDPDKAGKVFKPAKDEVVVMTSGGVFLLYHNQDYYPYASRLSEEIGNYDVVWNVEGCGNV